MEVETAFEKFKAANMERKTAVKNGQTSEKRYADWLFDRQGEIEKLME